MTNTRIRTTLVAAVAAVAQVSAQPSSAPAIPLCDGLTIVTAIDDPRGDYESVKRIRTVSPKSIDLTVNGDRPVKGAVRRINVRRTVLRDDLRSATFYLHHFDTAAPVTVPGSTALGTSTAVLKALKGQGIAEISVVDPSARAAESAVMRDHLWPYKIRRVGRVTVPVTLNGAKVELPAVHARGDYMGDAAEFFFLDDESNPLTLRYSFSNGSQQGDAGQLQVVQISYTCDPKAGVTAVGSRLERALQADGRADVYELFFEFNSARLREESAETLQEIAAVLSRRPDWALRIEGHTDSIAGDAYNLELSQRRAAAVKDALAAQYGVDPARLTPAGFGESRPKDRNDTLDGRARNRRVELVRGR